MTVTVVVSNVVTLDPRSAYLVRNMSEEILYTYYQTKKIAGIVWIFIDQKQNWFPKSYFKAHEICLN